MRKGNEKISKFVVGAGAYARYACDRERVVTAAGEKSITAWLSGITVKLTANGQTVIDNNGLVPGQSLPSNATVEMTISWTLPENAFYGKASAGDYFDIALPYNAINFAALESVRPLDENGVTLANWNISQSSPLHVTLTAAGAAKRELTGSFVFRGTTGTFTEGNTDIAVGDVIIGGVPVVPPAPVQTPDPNEPPPVSPPITSGERLYKIGGQIGYDNHRASYGILANYDNYVKMLNGQAFDTLKSTYLDNVINLRKSICWQRMFFLFGIM